MSLAVRHCLLIQRKFCFHNFASQRQTIASFPGNIGNFQKFTRTLQIKYFHAGDNGETNVSLIYTGKLKKRIRDIKAFALLTSCACLAIQPIIYMRCMEMEKSLFTMSAAFIMLLYTTCSPGIIHYLLGRKYVIELYYNPEKNEYIAVTYSLFNRRIRTVFTEDEVVVPDVLGPFTTCYVRGKPLFLNEEQFLHVEYFHKIMGHYKPIDFHLSRNVEKEKSMKE
nr:transmembrane protein 70 homolog, mitochondrial [Megalopta genalis]